MTEAEWLAETDDPVRMIRKLGRKCSKRKRRLFGCSCCRRICKQIPDDRSRDAVAVAESFADGIACPADLVSARSEARSVYEQFANHGPWDQRDAAAACFCVVMKYAGDAVHAWRSAAHAASRAGSTWYAEMAEQCRLVRDIFGNPFRPVALDAAWLTSTVVALAKGIYEERAFDRMPILADALQDAGCDHPDILDHCRGPGPHVRGCWVVDLILDKT
jgi:hypothetical protein